jgi:hypothetical protein
MEWVVLCSKQLLLVPWEAWKVWLGTTAETTLSVPTLSV